MTITINPGDRICYRDDQAHRGHSVGTVVECTERYLRVQVWDGYFEIITIGRDRVVMVYAK